MMKHIFFFTALAVHLAAFSQPSTFNKRIIFRNTADYEFASQLAETSYGYLVVGDSYTWTSSLSSDSRLVILKLDRQGNVLGKRIYGDSLNWYNCSVSKELLKTGDGNYMLLCQHFTSQTNYTTMLMKLNPEGDTLWTKTIYKEGVYDSRAFINTIAQTSDQGFVILGYSGMVIRTDSTGNVRWAKVITDNAATTYFNSAIPLSGGDVLLGFYSYIRVGSSIQGNCGIVRIDSSGNYKWWRGLSNLAFSGTNAVFLNLQKDSTILAFATYDNYDDPPNKKFEIMHLTTGNQLIGDTVFGPEDQISYMHGFTMLNDSTIAAGGSQGTRHGFVFNCTASGLSLFYKMLNAPLKGPGADPSSNTQVIYSMISTSDEGLLMAGVVYDPYSSDEGDPWILKTDRYGCFQPGCEPYAIYVTRQPDPENVCKGHSALFTIACTGDSVNRQWQIRDQQGWVNLNDGENYSGTRSDSLKVLHTDQLPESTLFRCRLENPKYTSYSHSAVLRILTEPTVTRQPEGMWVAAGGKAVLNAAGGGSYPLSYRWFYKDNLYPAGNDSILIIDPVTEEDASGPYHCDISNFCGEVSSINVYLKLYGAGLSSPDEPNTIKVFPNPASGKVNFLYSSGKNTVITYRIFDYGGREIHSNIFIHQTGLDISLLAPGLYFIEFSCDRSVIHRKLIIK